MRYTVAIVQMLLILVGLISPPGSATLVCKFTGKPMTPVAASPAYHSCCAVRPALTSVGQQFALASPGCCDLRQSRRSALPPTLAAVTPDISIAPAFVAIPTPPVPAVRTLPTRTRYDGPAIPRGPPPGSAAFRAPPALS